MIKHTIATLALTLSLASLGRVQRTLTLFYVFSGGLSVRQMLRSGLA
jgi:hypothetical protein